MPSEVKHFRKRARSIIIGLIASAIILGNVASTAASNTNSSPDNIHKTQSFSQNADCIHESFNNNSDGGGKSPPRLNKPIVNMCD